MEETNQAESIKETLSLNVPNPFIPFDFQGSAFIQKVGSVMLCTILFHALLPPSILGVFFNAFTG